MSNDPDEIQIPESGKLDVAYGLVKAGLSFIPTASDLFSLFVASPLEKRRNEFFEIVAHSLQILSEKVEDVNLESLLADVSFQTVVLSACREAVFNHEEENRLALRNVILNSALPNAPDDARKKMFVEWAGGLTAWHLKLLDFFQHAGLPRLKLGDPEWVMYGSEMDDLVEVITNKFPELEGQHHLYIRIIEDLYSRGLIANLVASPGMLTTVYDSPEVTPLGREFLRYIHTPPELNEANK